MKRKANENVLAGLACPKCKALEPFHIEATAEFLVCDDGTEDYTDVEWSPTSSCHCVACGERGTIATFTIKSRRRS